MRLVRGRQITLTFPLRAIAQRSAYALLASAAIALMIISQAEPRLVEGLRTGVMDITAPILDFFSHPAATVADGMEEVEAILTVHAKNDRLRAENAKLRKWQAAAEQLAYENAELRKLLRVIPDPRANFVTARVVADSGGPFVHMVLINAGEDEGIRKGQAVTNHEGVVGRIHEAGNRSARVLLLTDLNSRVPVVLESSRDRAVLAGDNSPRPRLDFLAVDAQVTPGERIVTSGEGGMFPPGLPVGIVASVNEDGAVVQPFVIWNRLEYVTILDYIVPGVLPQTFRADRVGSLQ